MFDLPELAVGAETVLDLVPKAGSVLRGHPHVAGDVHPCVLPNHDPVASVLPTHSLRLQTRQPHSVIKCNHSFGLHMTF